MFSYIYIESSKNRATTYIDYENRCIKIVSPKYLLALSSVQYVRTANDWPITTESHCLFHLTVVNRPITYRFIIVRYIRKESNGCRDSAVIKHRKHVYYISYIYIQGSYTMTTTKIKHFQGPISRTFKALRIDKLLNIF